MFLFTLTLLYTNLPLELFPKLFDLHVRFFFAINFSGSVHIHDHFVRQDKFIFPGLPNASIGVAEHESGTAIGFFQVIRKLSSFHFLHISEGTFSSGL